jgi:hypothetical protein
LKTSGLFFFVFIVFLSAGCAIFKRAEISVPPINSSNHTFEGVWRQSKYYKSLIFNNIDGVFNYNGKEIEFNASFKFANDSLVVVAIRSILGIEIFRIYMDMDSIYLLDRTNKEFQVFELKSLQNKYSDFLSVSSLKQLCLADRLGELKNDSFALLLEGSDFSKYGLEKGINSKDREMEVRIDYVLNKKLSKPVEFNWKSNVGNFHVLYTNYQFVEELVYPGNIEFKIKRKENEVLLSLKIGSLKVISSSNTHSSIPDDYKRKL